MAAEYRISLTPVRVVDYDIAAPETHPKRTRNAVNGATFDAFSAARALESAGVERAQAEAIVSAIAAKTVTRADLDPLATKADLATIRWAIGLIAAITFATALRVFGLI